jgi:hypothetical protein
MRLTRRKRLSGAVPEQAESRTTLASAVRAAHAAGTASRPLCYGSATQRGLTMNRNVTIGLGTLIVIIIIVALVF